MRICDYDGCENKHFAKGWCHGHYVQVWPRQDVRPLFARNAGKECSFEGCSADAVCKGLCGGHYTQRRRGQQLRPLHDRSAPNDAVVIGPSAWLVLTDRRGREVARTVIDVPDLADVRAIGRWCLHSDGYCVHGGASLHRYLMGHPDELEVDHIDGDRLNNRRANLRAVTRSEQMQNIAHAGREDIRNCHWRPRRKAWAVYVNRAGVRHHVGEFLDVDDARAAAADARTKLLTHSVEERHEAGGSGEG